MRYSGRKVLITGAGGFIGSHLAEACIHAGASVRAFVHYNSRNDWGMLENLDRAVVRQIDVFTGDLRDPDSVRRSARGMDIVFHLGALVGIPYSYRHPGDVVSTNVLGTLNVLQACLEMSVARLVQTSTSEVYGTAREVPMTEEHPLRPQSPYAASKVGADQLAESYWRTYGLPVVVLRPFNTYGPRQSPRAVIPTILLQALAGSRVRLGSLTARRDFTYVTDTVRGFLLAGSRSRCEGKVIQIGSGRDVSVRDLVRMVGGLMGRRLRLVQERRRVRPRRSEVERLVAGTRRAAVLLGWKPTISLEEGLAETLEWFKQPGRTGKTNLYHV